MKIVDLALIRVEGSFVLQEIESVFIKTELNQHGICVISAVVDEAYYRENQEMFLKEEGFKIIYEADQKKTILFTGYLQEIRTFAEAGLYKVVITGFSYSRKMDEKQESHSYQDISMDYGHLIETVMGDDGTCILPGRYNKRTGMPLIWFQNTKWEFLCQIAGKLSQPIIPSCVGERADIRIGISKDKVHVLKNIQYQKLVADMGVFWYSERDEMPDSCCICYEVETYDFFRLGDQVIFHGLEWIAARAELISKEGFVTHRYLLVQEKGIPFFYPCGREGKNYSLSGTVLQICGNQVKVHLDIDKEQKEETAYPYQYYPITGNVMYAMPEIGARVILNVTEHFPGGGIVTDCLPDRKRESDHRQKQLKTEDGKQIFMGPQRLLLENRTRKGRQSVSMDDRNKFNVLSSAYVQMKANEKIRLETTGGVTIGAGAYMGIRQSGTINEIAFSGNEIIHTAVRHDYSSGKQSPRKMEEKTETAAFPSEELADVLFGLFACENLDVMEKAFLGAQPVAASPNMRKWKKMGKGFGVR